MPSPLRVGLLGAGPWARFVHAPSLAALPSVAFAGVWARRPDAAEELAASHGVPAFATVDALLERCEAVAIAVPPDVQVDLALQAIGQGKAVLLEKPIADTPGRAEELAEAVGAAGVGSLVLLSGRFAADVRAFLAAAETFEAVGGRGCFLSGAFLGGPFSHSPWRQQRGALLDVGPHSIDLIDAALGPVVELDARASDGGWVALQLGHASGAASQLSLCATTGITPSRAGAELYGPAGVLEVDVEAAIGPAAFATAFTEFVEVARFGGPHPCDVHRGAYLQRLIGQAEAALA